MLNARRLLVCLMMTALKQDRFNYVIIDPNGTAQLVFIKQIRDEHQSETRDIHTVAE
jgi:hypothetical protein